MASAFANALAQAFIDRQIALFARPGAADFFQRQKLRFDEELKSSAVELERFSRVSGVFAAEDQRQLLLKRLNDLSQALAFTRSSVSEKLGQRQALAAQLRKLAPVARSSYVSSLVDSLTDDRPGAAARAADTRAADERLNEAPLLLVKVYQDSMVLLFKINSDLAGAEMMQKQQASELASVMADLNKLSTHEQSYAELKRTMVQAATNSDLYARRAVEEQISVESSDAKFSSVKVLQRATEPLSPVFPNYMLATAFSAFAGMMAGLGTVSLKGAVRARTTRVVTPIQRDLL